MIRVAFAFVLLVPFVVPLGTNACGNAAEDTPTTRDQTKASRDPEYYKGESDADWVRSTIRTLQHKISCDAIIVAMPGESHEREKRVESEYIIQRVLTGGEFLKSYIKRKDFGGKLGVKPSVVVEYRKFDDRNSPYARSAPDGLTVLFLNRPPPKRDHLAISGDWVYDGMIYATKEIVEQVEDGVRRLDKILSYFKENGFPLKKNEDGLRWVIDETDDGAYTSTNFWIFAASRDHDDILHYLKGCQAATIYNPECKIAILTPGVTGPPNTPDGWKPPERLTRHMGRYSRFSILAEEYRPK